MTVRIRRPPSPPGPLCPGSGFSEFAARLHNAFHTQPRSACSFPCQSPCSQRRARRDPSNRPRAAAFNENTLRRGHTRLLRPPLLQRRVPKKNNYRYRSRFCNVFRISCSALERKLHSQHFCSASKDTKGRNGNQTKTETRLNTRATTQTATNHRLERNDSD